MILPDYITRFYLKHENPFMSLNMLPIEEAEKRKKEHCMKYSIGGFYADESYLSTRRKIEEYIYKILLKKGGSPKTTSPVYFSFGRMQRTKNGYRDRFRNDIREIRIPLKHLDLSVISFVHPDSMYECIYDENGMYVKSQRTDTPEVYVYDDLKELITKYRLHNKEHLYQIEAQVWDLESLESLDKTQYEIYNY